MRKGGAAMRCKSEETMEQIKNAVEEFYFSHYRSPSIGELAAEVGYAKSTVHSYLWEMDRRGLLSYNGCSQKYPQQLAVLCYNIAIMYMQKNEKKRKVRIGFCAHNKNFVKNY